MDEDWCWQPSWHVCSCKRCYWREARPPFVIQDSVTQTVDLTLLEQVDCVLSRQ